MRIFWTVVPMFLGILVFGGAATPVYWEPIELSQVEGVVPQMKGRQAVLALEPGQSSVFHLKKNQALLFRPSDDVTQEELLQDLAFFTGSTSLLRRTSLTMDPHSQGFPYKASKGETLIVQASSHTTLQVFSGYVGRDRTHFQQLPLPGPPVKLLSEGQPGGSDYHQLEPDQIMKLEVQGPGILRIQSRVALPHVNARKNYHLRFWLNEEEHLFKLSAGPDSSLKTPEQTHVGRLRHGWLSIPEGQHSLRWESSSSVYLRLAQQGGNQLLFPQLNGASNSTPSPIALPESGVETTYTPLLPKAGERAHRSQPGPDGFDRKLFTRLPREGLVWQVDPVHLRLTFTADNNFPFWVQFNDEDPVQYLALIQNGIARGRLTTTSEVETVRIYADPAVKAALILEQAQQRPARLNEDLYRFYARQLEEPLFSWVNERLDGKEPLPSPPPLLADHLSDFVHFVEHHGIAFAQDTALQALPDHHPNSLDNDAEARTEAGLHQQALTAWSRQANASDGRYLERAEVLVKLGEHFLARNLLKAVMWLDPQPEKRHQAFQQLHNFYDVQRDGRGQTSLAAARFYRERDRASLNHLAQVLLTRGERHLALCAVLLSPSPQKETATAVAQLAGWPKLFQEYAANKNLFTWETVGRKPYFQDAAARVASHWGGVSVWDTAKKRSIPHFQVKPQQPLTAWFSGPVRVRFAVRQWEPARGAWITVDGARHWLPLPRDATSGRNGFLTFNLGPGQHRVQLEAPQGLLLARMSEALPTAPPNAMELKSSELLVNHPQNPDQARAWMRALHELATRDQLNQALLVRGAQLASQYAIDESVNQLFREVKIQSRWRPVKTVNRHGGVQTRTAPKAPVNQYVGNRAALMPSPNFQQKLVWANGREGLKLRASQSGALQLELQLEAMPGSPLKPIDLRVRLGKNKRQVVTLRDNLRLIFPVKKGENHLQLQFKDAPANQFVRLALQEGAEWVAERRSYFRATQHNPVVLRVHEPVWLRLEWVDKGEPLVEERYVTEAPATLSMKPPMGGATSWLRISERRLQEETRAVPKTVANWTLPKTAANILSPQISHQPQSDRPQSLVSIFQSPGTWDARLSSRTREWGDEDEAHRREDRYHQFAGIYRFSHTYGKTRLRLRYRERSQDPETLALDARHFYQMGKNRFNASLSYFTQSDLVDQSGGSQSAYAMTARLSWSRRFQLTPALSHLPKAQIFGRQLSMERKPGSGPAPDFDVYTTYKRDHQHGLALSDVMTFQPFRDARVRAELNLLSNEDLSLDRTALDLSWRHMMGPFQIGAGVNGRQYFADTDRSQSLFLTRYRLEALWFQQRNSQQRWELGLRLEVGEEGRFDGALSFGWVFGGPDYRHYAPEEIPFRSLKTQRNQEVNP